MKRLTLILSVATIGFFGCSDEGCNDPLAFNYDPEGTTSETCVWQPLSVNVTITPTYMGEEVKFGDAYTTSGGRSIQFDFLAMYLTEFNLKVDDALVPMFDENEPCADRRSDAMLWLDDDRTYTAQFLPSSDVDVKGIQFTVGVDTCRNNNVFPPDQTDETDVFAPKVPTMYWSWTAGYRFVTLEGMVDASADADGSDIKKFEYHTGLNQFIRTVSIDLESWERSGSDLNLALDFKLDALLESVDFTTELSTHTFDNQPLAEKITNNIQNAIVIRE